MPPYDPTTSGDIGPLGNALVILLILAVYVYTAYCNMTISHKTKTPHAWWSWIPILSTFQVIKMAAKSYWWFLLCLIPIGNLIATVYLWMEIAKRRGFGNWLGILMIIPIANLVIPGYLAFAEPTPSAKT